MKTGGKPAKSKRKKRKKGKKKKTGQTKGVQNDKEEGLYHVEELGKGVGRPKLSSFRARIPYSTLDIWNVTTSEKANSLEYSN